MLEASRDTPSVSGPCLIFLGAKEQPDAAADEIASLLVRVRMTRQDRTSAQPKLGHEGPLAMNQRFALYPVQRWTVPITAPFLEHAR